ncbi:MAG: hypothetical protein DWQ07_12870 [Chloroflexi bacterium]|nr:MAG: hypothetical protein DWQ07_12870 [Chloroflexota bacterium]MBL1196932.1 hypothetical protein [Chloroflexota bacterium]NOH14228.1 hypothetical protein [Chloroflexota bacterium]
MITQVMPQIYMPPFGTPLYWRDEVSGRLPSAVWAYINHVTDSQEPALTYEQLCLVINYCQYFINAPCWEDGMRMMERMGVLNELREQAQELRCVPDIRAWIRECLKYALDPI